MAKRKKSSQKATETRKEPAIAPGARSAALPWIIGAALLIAGFLLFARLGHYSLWDDESMDALSARGILQTGDTSAMLGHNIVAYRNGLLLVNLRHQGMPPFTGYAAAASMKLLGQSAFAARLPLALCGFACAALMLYWMWKWKSSTGTAALLSIGILGNVSFFLYSRQCHYYGAAMLFYVAIAYIYLNWQGNRRMLAAMGIVSALLMAANYSFFLVLYGLLALDYFLWQRKKQPFKIADLAILFAPQLIMGLILLAYWNPLQTELGSYLGHDSGADRLTLYFWNWRDLNNSEIAAGVLLLAAPFVAFTTGNLWLKRMLLALVVYVTGMTILSTQIVANTSVADVRYLSAIIPLCIAIEAFTLRALMPKARFLAIPVALLLFGTNLMNGGPLLKCGARSTIASYVGELANPPGEPYSPASAWINENVKEGESVWVLPDYMVYPLMFNAPKAVYAWQLKWPPKPQFKGLPLIHFEGQAPPDYILAFGPMAQDVRQTIAGWQGTRYEQVATLDCYWRDLYRPELFWRTFKPVTQYDRNSEAIYAFKRVSPN